MPPPRHRTRAGCSSSASGREPGWTSFSVHLRGIGGGRLRCRQSRVDRRVNECRAVLNDQQLGRLGGAVGLRHGQPGRCDHALGSGVPRTAGTLARDAGRELRPGRDPDPGRPMDAAVGAAGPHDPADLETGAGREGCLGQPGGWSRARRMGTEWLCFDTDRPRLSPPAGPDSCLRSPPACSPGPRWPDSFSVRSSPRTRVRIGAPPPPRPRPVMSRTMPPGRALAWARRKRSALATASITLWPCRSKVASGDRSVQSSIVDTPGLGPDSVQMGEVRGSLGNLQTPSTPP